LLFIIIRTEKYLTIRFKKKNNMSESTFRILLSGRTCPLNKCWALQKRKFMITKTVSLGATICAFTVLLAGCSIFESAEK